MAEHGDDDLTAEDTPGYVPPAQKSVEEILKADAEDESLRKYKEALLGTTEAAGLEVCKLTITLNVPYFRSLCDAWYAA